MEVLAIIKEWLDQHPEYDGLVNEDCCACEKEDLSPGNCLCDGCEAGHKIHKDEDGLYPGEEPDDPELLDCCPRCEWHMIARQRETEEES